MRIAIDARQYFFRAGLGRYVRGVVDNLIHRFPNDEYVLLISNHKNPDDLPFDETNIKIVVSRAEVNNIDQEWDILHKEMDHCEADVIYFPTSTISRECNAPTIYTVHDITQIRIPYNHTKEGVKYMEKFLPEILERIGLTITVSQYVQDDLKSFIDERQLRSENHQIAFAHPGVDESFFIRLDKRLVLRILDKYRLTKGGYFLFVGSIEPRKNLAGILKAYEMANVNIPIVIAGVERWLPEEFKKTLDTLKRKEKVQLLGFVPDEDLPSLYQGSLAVLYASFSEGFGFPIAEAYASGVPILTSNNSSMKEIGSAALLVDPHDLDQMAVSIAKLANSPELRTRLADQGAIESQNYRWDKCVDRIHSLFEEILKSK